MLADVKFLVAAVASSVALAGCTSGSAVNAFPEGCNPTPEATQSPYLQRLSDDVAPYDVADFPHANGYPRTDGRNVSCGDVDRFRVEEFDLVELQAAVLPRARPSVSSIGEPVDGEGVRFYRNSAGIRAQHPVVLLDAALTLLNNHRLTGEPKHLELASAHVEQLLEESVTAREALWFPYDFTFALHGNGDDIMSPPWYSALAQGLALSAFAELFRITRDERYAHYTELVLASFQVGPHPEEPWVAFVDASGFLWLEEYPKSPPMQVLNGTISAAFGLYDAWNTFGSEAARELLLGAVTTVKNYLPDYRNPRGLSFYGRRWRESSQFYHDIHLRFLRKLTDITRDPAFRDAARQFEEDALVTPRPVPQP